MRILIDGRAIFESLANNRRHGYEVVFHDRQRLLQVLYENLKNKDKIFLKKRVIDVAATSSGVSIQTQDGDTFAGDIIVGGDGIHSTVRKEMWRIADEVSPGFFPEDELKRRWTLTHCSKREQLMSGFRSPHRIQGAVWYLEATEEPPANFGESGLE